MSLDEEKVDDALKDIIYRVGKLERNQKQLTSKIKRLEEDKADKKQWRA